MLRRAARALAKSPWADVKLGPPDAILGLTVAYNNDTDPRKVNLGVGAYRDDSGKPYVLECVRKAEKKTEGMDKEYAGVSGVAKFNQLSQKLMFGKNDARIVTAQAISGTGALRVAADFLERFYPAKEVYMPNPTWANHGPIFSDAGLKPKEYKYYNPATFGLDIDGMIKDLEAAPKGSIVLLHVCAHNPTGVDPTPEQWQRILDVVKKQEHFAFLDAAYQGFASGDIEGDVAPVRLFYKADVPMLVCQSFAKNFGLYGERAGAVHFVCKDEEEAKRLDSQVKILIRPMYSNPPVHGARIVANVLEDPELVKLWEKEVKQMAERIYSMRVALKDGLSKAGSTKNWDHITKQIGMFSFTGLNKSQVERLIKDFHIYLTANGRISMCGLTPKNVKYVAESIHEVTK